MNAALNAPTLCITVIGLLAALVTTRWFTVQVCHWPPHTGDRIAAFLPLLMGIIIFWLLPTLFPHRTQADFADVVGAAFGIGFSLAIGRAQSRYSRILGALFLFIYGWVLIAMVVNLVAGGI
jgi:hypothetical protein